MEYKYRIPTKECYKFQNMTVLIDYGIYHDCLCIVG